jgi:uncharacterized protein YkwD
MALLLSRFTFVLAVVTLLLAQPGRSAQAQFPGWVELRAPVLFCSGRTVAAHMSWASPRLSTEHWVDLSLEDNGFAEGTFLSAGPLGVGTNAYVWAGLQPGTVHYWRVVSWTGESWLASDTGTFETCELVADDLLPPLETAPDFNVTREMEMDLFHRHNIEREEARVGKLQLDEVLTRVARERARDMASREYVAHFSPYNDNAFSMLWQLGYSFINGAENIGQNDYPMSRAVGAVMLAFRDSAPHYETIIDPRFTHVGVGVAVTRQDLKYFVVVFAQR